MKRNWTLVALFPVMLFVLYMVFVKLPEMKCDRLASDLQATSYAFSPVNGCYILQPNGTWLVSPNYTIHGDMDRSRRMKGILVILLIVLVVWLVFVALPEAKCAGIAQDRNATYLFSAVRGCEIRTRHMSWLLTPSYLREYQREP